MYDYSQANYLKQLEKKVLATKSICEFKSTDDFVVEGPGVVTISKDFKHENNNTIKLVNPTVSDQNPRAGLIQGCTRIRVLTNNADWRDYNRISFWIYAVDNGTVSADLSLEFDNVHNYMAHSFALPSLHGPNFKTGQWAHIVWEIPDIDREAVKMIQINFVLRGYQQQSSPDETYYISEFQLEKVENPEKYKGWSTEGKIAFCHSGYAPQSEKKAVCSQKYADTFEITDANTNKTVFTANVKEAEATNGNGKYCILDFSDLKETGEYKIKFGKCVTEKFVISNNHFNSCIDKMIHFFYTQRCGCHIDGIHTACHKNAFVKHPDGRKLNTSGGWHDAGDLSQGLCNTAESAHSMLDMARAVKGKDEALYNKLLDEAMYGLDWMLNTRFGDGYRLVWFGINRWTTGQIGVDDFERDADNSAFENLCAAAAEAEAYKLYKDTKPYFANWCLKAAKEDFVFAQNVLSKPNTVPADPVQIKAEASFAASCLYRATGEKVYLEKAIEYGKYVLACQQTELTNWDKPVRGFFYNDDTKDMTLTYDHRAHDQVLIAALAEIVQSDAAGSQKAPFVNALKLYRDYILFLNGYSAPYGLLPTAIYFWDKPTQTTHSGAHGKSAMDIEEHHRYLENAIPLGKGAYLRKMPVFAKFTGSFGIQLSKAKAVSILAKALDDKNMMQIAVNQLQWIIGTNPFCKSFVYGEGYDYQEFCTGHSTAGQMPVGIKCYKETDEPYMPFTIATTFGEVWVHTVCRMLWTVADVIEE